MTPNLPPPGSRDLDRSKAPTSPSNILSRERDLECHATGFYLQGSVHWISAETDTPADSGANTVPPDIVPDWDNDYWSAIAQRRLRDWTTRPTSRQLLTTTAPDNYR